MLRPSVLAVTTVALVAAGGVFAYAGWSSGTDSGSFTIYAATIPKVPAPRAAVPGATAVPPSDAGSTAGSTVGRIAGGSSGGTAVEPARPARPRIGWRPVRLAADVPVHRYVVTRHLGPVTEVVCERPATVVLRCVDRTAPAGYRMSYTVAARHGAHWVGADSERSAVITTPGIAVPVTVNGVAVLPGVDGEPVVPGVDPSASAGAVPSVAATSPGAEPSVEPSEDDGSGPGTGVTIAPNPPDPVVPVPSGSAGVPDDSATDPEVTEEPSRGPGNGPPPNLPGPPPGLPAPPGLGGPPPRLPF
ncbi:MAG TPA: hypothetical protein VF657_09075 [Actinoplanes sp.]